MNESEARTALRELGVTPTPELIRNWIRAAEVEHRLQAEEWELTGEHPQPPAVAQQSDPTSSKSRADGKPQGSSNSVLKPVLVQQGTLEKPPVEFIQFPAGYKRRKSGRPRIIASWFPAVAKTMADGTTLRTALAINGLSLRANEMRALYRNRAFQALYQQARRRFLIENWGHSKMPSLRSVLGRLL